MTTLDPAPRVTVVMPTYRRPEMLREALGSAVAQTLRDLEILVCDNADDPAARQVVESFADDRITYLGRPENLGMIGNALDGFRRARGEFVIKLDDDDAFEPDALATMLAGFDDRPDVTASFCDLRLVDVHGQTLAADTEQVQRDTHRAELAPGLHQPFSGLAAQGAVSLSGSLLRRASIDWDRVPEQAGTSYDLYLTMAAARGGAAAWYTKRPLVRYRIHGANDSVKNVVPSLEASQWILQDAQASGQHGDREVMRQRIAQDDARLAREYLLRGDTGRCRRSALASLRVRPTPGAAATLVLGSLPRRLGTRISQRRREAYLGASAPTATAPTPDH
ncbi:glycosyltransferase family 2 protein [Arsenicicoccus sp. oral taxon 190]|uniref:glycosyltransferase family 2 protein n=1 Tax=Arsenicicoccus sp. oral taxon 190 TaxID=1658671 RepID=UPI00067D8FAB|nr:glycosyltransferase family 2 protein [Arsenicicoccus sp. oral taxon 190]